jgi:hypothetical protein
MTLPVCAKTEQGIKKRISRRLDFCILLFYVLLIKNLFDEFRKAQAYKKQLQHELRAFNIHNSLKQAHFRKSA